MARHSETENGSWLVKLIFLGSVPILIFISLALVKESSKKKEVEKEILSLKQEAERIEKENSILAEKISYFESKDYQEKEAKDKLNLQNPEENVVVIKPGLTKKTEGTQEEISDQNKVIVQTSNLQKWWNYFFKY